MKLGTTLKLKKDWNTGVFEFEKGDTFKIVSSTINSHIQLSHINCKNPINFNTTQKPIEEYFETIQMKEEGIKYV